MRPHSRSSWLLILIAWTAVQARAADKVPPVDEEFLEDLGTMDDDGADWTLFEARETRPSADAPKLMPSNPSEDEATPVSKPTASKPTVSKPTASKPTVPEQK
jgi:hypothetical protein